MAEEENSHLTYERLSLLMELGATKEDFAAFWEKSSAKKWALEAEFDASSDVLFNNGYGCCAFAHDIYGRKSMIPTEMPDTSTPLTPKYFMNPRCPPSSSFVLPAVEPVETAGEDLLAKDLLAAEGGVDISSRPPTKSDKEPKVVAEG